MARSWRRRGPRASTLGALLLLAVALVHHAHATAVLQVAVLRTAEGLADVLADLNDPNTAITIFGSVNDELYLGSNETFNELAIRWVWVCAQVTLLPRAAFLSSRVSIVSRCGGRA